MLQESIYHNPAKDDTQLGKYIYQADCPICFSGSTKALTRVKTINPHADETVELKECLMCGHWWHSTLPEQAVLSSMYKDGSEYVVPRNYSSSINSDTKEEEILWQKILDSITKYLHKHKISEKEYNYLEVGIGEGKLFNFFKKHTNIACGIEPGVWGKQENCIIYSDIQDVPKEISFDIMVANDVLEHLTEPKEMLSLMHQKANDGCIVRCTFPNKDSLKAKMQKGTWHMVRPFGHLHYFSKRSIENLFEQAGWTIVELEATRIAQNSALDLIKKFDTKERNILYRIVKSLLLGQILLGKDQWVVIAKKSSQ